MNPGIRSETGSRRQPDPDLSNTDLSNARQLVARDGKDLRYCHDSGQWFIWDGKRWMRDRTDEVMRRAKATVDEIAEYDAPRAKKAMARERLSAMIALARSELGIHVLMEEFDSDPYLLNVSNGTIDLRTGVLRGHRREDLQTKLAPAEFNEWAACPTFDRFLSEVLPDADVRAFLQRAVGYALTGNTSEQCLFFLYGSGANGKSTFLGIMQDMLGEYALQAAPDLLIAKERETIPCDVAELKGTRFVSCVEVESGKRLAESLVKQLTGGDKVKARFMGRDFFEFPATHKLFLAANHCPVIRGTDHAIWRRIHLIPWEVCIPPERRDPQLLEKLRAELPGILAWAVNGLRDWQEGGLRPPEAVRAATQEYRQDMDRIGPFLEECCVLAPNASVAIGLVRQAYETWCEQNGERPASPQVLKEYLQMRGCKQAHPHGQPREWREIGLVAAECWRIDEPGRPNDL